MQTLGKFQALSQERENERHSDARSAPSTLDEWVQRNGSSKPRAINSPVTSKEWRRIWLTLGPYLAILTGFAAYIVWAWWPK